MRIVRYDNGAATRAEDELAVEEPLEIRVRGRAISVTMRMRGHDDELAIEQVRDQPVGSRRLASGVAPNTTARMLS